MDFRSTTPADREQIRELLRGVFRASDDAPFLDRRHLEWKYYAQRSCWPGSRSFVLADGGRLIAHACAWPFHVMFNGSTIRGFHPVDWASRPEARGTGTLLLREIRNVTDISLSIGGTEASRKAIINTGYRPPGDIKFYARPLRPLLHARTHQRRNWKLPARLARNWWNTRSFPKARNGWASVRIDARELPPGVLPVSSEQVTACVRSPDLFYYYEQCPIARHELHLVKQHGEPKGYFLLSLVPGQARVADAWVNTAEVQEWEALYRLAAEAALDDTHVAEITAPSSLPFGQSALAQAGFKPYETLPVMLFDPEKTLDGAPPVHFQWIDNDFSFLHQGRPDYVL